MGILEEHLKQNPIIYVTRNIERALGANSNLEGYFIISNFTPFAKNVSAKRKNVLLIKENKLLDTWELLEHPKTSDKLIRSQPEKFGIIVFKNTKHIENICQKNNWSLLNPSARLADKIEAKISQIKFFPKLKDLFPPHSITVCGDAACIADKQILQFDHSHSGEGTLLIENKNQLENLKQKFPKRKVRITKYIEGPIFTNNNIVHKNGVLIGNISYQITGLKPYTRNQFATVGNDWGVVKKILNKKQIEEYKNIAKKVGKELKKKGWKGLFGIDVVLEKETDKMYLIEINARQPASAAYESRLQEKAAEKNNSLLTVFEAHLCSLLQINISDKNLIRIENGSQIIDRRTNKHIKFEYSIMEKQFNNKK